MKCWKRHLQKVGIVQYFTPMGLCHEEADKATDVSGVEGSTARHGKSKDDDDDDDVEGYDLLL